MNNLSIRNQIMHEQVVDSVMHTTNGGMTTAAGMTTDGKWKDRGKEMLAVMGFGISAKRKAEIKAHVDEYIAANNRRREKQRLEYEKKCEEERLEFLRDEILEKERNERLRKKGLIRRPSWDDDGQSCLPPWQRSHEAIELHGMGWEEEKIRK